MLTAPLGSIPPIIPPSASGSIRGGVPAIEAEVAVGSGASTDSVETARNRRTNESQASPESGQRRADQNAQGLSEEELSTLTELKARDREVRAHESAHQAVGGQYAGSVSYVYQRGPDGAQYAVGGEVSIDLSPVAGDPQATIEKMRVVRAAAMAPAQPSGQDRAVAAEAMQIMLQAQAELVSGENDKVRPEVSENAEADEGSSPDQADQAGREATRIYRSVSTLAAGPGNSPASVLDAIA